MDLVDSEHDGRESLRSAALEFSRDEICCIAERVRDDLRSRPATDTFPEVAARHLWDEYCWALQEGPFDDVNVMEDASMGSLSGAFSEVVSYSIAAELETLPSHLLVLLSAKAFDESLDRTDRNRIGSVWTDGVAALVLEQINSVASRRHLDLIGPNRKEEVLSEAEGEGVVWSILSDRDETTSLLSEKCDTILDADADLSDLADELIDVFIDTVGDEYEGYHLSALLKKYPIELRAFLLEKDVIPSLLAIRRGLLKKLDD